MSVSFAMQKLFSLMRPICSFFLFDVEPFVSCLGSQYHIFLIHSSVVDTWSTCKTFKLILLQPIKTSPDTCALLNSNQKTDPLNLRMLATPVKEVGVA
jgi:hypothetical protein